MRRASAAARLKREAAAHLQIRKAVVGLDRQSIAVDRYHPKLDNITGALQYVCSQ